MAVVLWAVAVYVMDPFSGTFFGLVMLLLALSTFLLPRSQGPSWEEAGEAWERGRLRAREGDGRRREAG